jgi:hypothetical protein
LRRRLSRPKLPFEASGSWSNPQFLVRASFIFLLYSPSRNTDYTSQHLAQAMLPAVESGVKPRRFGAPMIRAGSHAAALRHDMHRG